MALGQELASVLRFRNLNLANVQLLPFYKQDH